MLVKPQIWHNDVVFEFVENYKSEPILWDPKHPDYKSKPKLQHAWERIKERMSVECSIVDLKKKKESLMSAYRLQNKKRREDPSTQISWFAFDQMDAFLGAIYNPPEDNSLSDQELLGDSEDHEYFERITRPIKKERRISLSTSNYTPRKRPSGVTYSYVMPEREMRESDNIQDFDECELYARLLAKKMRRLDERQRDIVMHEIDNIVFRAKMNSEKVKKAKSPESPVFIVTGSNDYEEEYLEEHIMTD